MAIDISIVMPNLQKIKVEKVNFEDEESGVAIVTLAINGSGGRIYRNRDGGERIQLKVTDTLSSRISLNPAPSRYEDIFILEQEVATPGAFAALKTAWYGAPNLNARKLAAETSIVATGVLLTTALPV